MTLMIFGLNNVLYISSCGLDAVRERGNNCAEVDRDARFLASVAFSTAKYAGTSWRRRFSLATLDHRGQVKLPHASLDG